MCWLGWCVWCWVRLGVLLMLNLLLELLVFCCGLRWLCGCAFLFCLIRCMGCRLCYYFVLVRLLWLCVSGFVCLTWGWLCWVLSLTWLIWFLCAFCDLPLVNVCELVCYVLYLVYLLLFASITRRFRVFIVMNVLDVLYFIVLGFVWVWFGFGCLIWVLCDLWVCVMMGGFVLGNFEFDLRGWFWGVNSGVFLFSRSFGGG